MNLPKNPFRSTLTAMRGPTPFNEEEINQLRSKAWEEQGILIVSLSDNRLNEAEKKLLCQLGERFFGKGGQV